MLGEHWLLLLLKRKSNYHFNDTVSNISIGIVERFLNVSFSLFSIFWFDYLFNHFALFQFETKWYAWFLLFLLIDFLWYWYHRLGHEIALFWAFHIVHHQSSTFNLTTATRITILQAFVRILFWSVLPIIGFDPKVIYLLLLVHGLYSFFTHTEVIGKLGFLENIFITPSHHRVHHASNEKYLDKNYGDVFVFWDKLFHTFQVEEEAPVYGLTKPLGSHSFLWQHFHYLIELYLIMGSTKGVVNKFNVLIATPDVVSEEIQIKAKELFHIVSNKHKQISYRLKYYILIQLLVALGILEWFLISSSIDVFGYVYASVLIILTMINCGALLEKKKWTFFVEYLRLGFLFMGLLFYSTIEGNSVISVFLVSIITLYYHSFKRIYVRLILC